MKKFFEVEQNTEVEDSIIDSLKKKYGDSVAGKIAIDAFQDAAQEISCTATEQEAGKAVDEILKAYESYADLDFNAKKNVSKAVSKAWKAYCTKINK